MLQEKILEKQGYLDDRVSQYQALGILGEGSFGTVILCKHKHSGIKQALKIIKKKRIQEVYTANG